MKRIRKDLSRAILALMILPMGLVSCEMDKGVEVTLSEFGAKSKEYVVDWSAGDVDIEILSNQKYNVSLVDSYDTWVSVDTPSSGVFSGDANINTHYETNHFMPRMAGVRIWSESRCDTVYIKQRGYITPSISLEMQNLAVLGDGGSEQVKLNTNLEKEDIDVDIVYTNGHNEDWITGLDICNGFLLFDATANTSEETLRNASITLSYVDGWGVKYSSTLYVIQANSLNEFGVETTFADLRGREGVINDDIYIEGVVISDVGNGNNGENMMLTNTAIDYDGTYKTAYIQSADGQYGFRILTSTVEDNIFERYSTVRILLRGVTITTDIEPRRYTLSGVKSTMVMSSVRGDESSVVSKERTISELTDDDIYTWVTLKDCELPVRKGSLTPINEGYARNCGINRLSKYPTLVRDIDGNSLYMYTNTTCLYRRDGSMLPYGSGSVSGVLVHEKYDRFEWGGMMDSGDIGRYQIRHLTREDMDFEEDFANSFSELLTEYRYMKLDGGVLKPTTGDNGFLTHTVLDGDGNAAVATTDGTYLGPIGDKNNADKEGPTSGIHEGNVNGNGVVEDGLQMSTHVKTNSDGKGNLDAGDKSAWVNWAPMWNAESDRSEAWLLHLSTEGITTDQLSMQLSVMEREATGGPRYIKVSWSMHGDNNRDDWFDIGEFTLPTVVNWAPTLLTQTPGYKNVNMPLPLDLLGYDDVVIRFSAASNKSAGTANESEYDSKAITKGGFAFSYIGVRYNK